MVDYLTYFWEELYPFFNYLIEELFSSPVVDIFVSVILILGVTGAVLRMIFH